MDTTNNNNGAGSEPSSQGDNSSQEQSGALSSIEIQSRLADILGDDPLIAQAEPDESDSNQSEDQQSYSESETDTTTETDGETEEVHSQSEEDDSNEDISRGVQKRIDKLTAKRKEAEEQLEALRKEVEDLKASQSQRPIVAEIPDVPHSNLESVAEIEAEIAQARAVRNWAEQNADGFTQTDKDGNETYYDPAQIRQIKVNAMKALEETLPQRYQYIQHRDNLESVVAKEYPWWKDKTSQERIIAEKFLASFPAIKRFPDYKMVIGDYIRGVRAREANLKGQKNIPKAPSIPRATSSAPTVKKQELQSRDAYSKFKQTGRADDLSRIIEDFL